MKQHKKRKPKGKRSKRKVITKDLATGHNSTCPADQDHTNKQNSNSDTQAGAVNNRDADAASDAPVSGVNNDQVEHDDLSQASAIYAPSGFPPEEKEVCGGGNPISLANLTLPQDFLDGLTVEKLETFIHVGKPRKSWWVRVHPDESYQLDNTLVLDYEDEIYLIAPPIRKDLLSETCVVQRRIVTAITRQGQVFLWPLKPPCPNGRVISWSQSAFQASNAAKVDWVRVISNMSKKEYEVLRAKGPLAEPAWPKETFNELLKIAFKDRWIDSLDHEILRQLRGEV
jgi:hypothetical protein